MDDIKIVDIKMGDRFREDYGDIEELIASIKKYGLIQPITVDEEYRLIAGGRRLTACTAIGMDSISCIIRKSDALDSLEVELVENIHRKDLEWQERAKLEKRIFEMQGKGGTIRSVAALIGSSRSAVHDHIQMADAMEVMPELANHKTEDEAWKHLQKLQEKLAIDEIIKRAKQRIVDNPLSEKEQGVSWGDSAYIISDSLDGMSELRNGTYDFAEVDPPYGIDLKEKKRGKAGGKDLEDYAEFEGGEGYDYVDFLYDMLCNVHSVLADDAFAIVWFGHTHYQIVKEVMIKVRFKVNEIPGVWYKGAQGQTQQPQIHLANCYEQFMVGRKGDPILHKQGRSNVFHFNPVPGGQKIHPTERPIKLMDEILDTFSYPDQRILVPFAGSGNTLLSAHRSGRNCIGFDIVKEFKNKFLLRLEEGDGDEVEVEDDTV